MMAAEPRPPADDDLAEALATLSIADRHDAPTWLRQRAERLAIMRSLKATIAATVLLEAADDLEAGKDP